MTQFLNSINTPGDLKCLTVKELDKLAREIRDFIIKTVSRTGGHLASNLGVVELTLALHYHLNSPGDKIIWDVGHQSYTHKILTGRRDKMNSLRQSGGLSGYPKFKESEHDIIETGHSSTSISSALGLALARDLKGGGNRVYAVIGDGALTGGMAFEALNHAGHQQADFTVILNDNAMSISPNVGALSHYLSKIRTDPRVKKMKEDIEFILNHIPRIGHTVSRSVERIKDGLKYILLSGILFEEMGFTYIGPLDGHNIGELLENFDKADQIRGPVLIHVNTQKGRGYRPAEKNPSKYHGVSPFKVDTGQSEQENKYLTYSQVFGQTMVKLGRIDRHVIGITAAMPEGTGLSIFKESFPERFFDVGIAEQHAVTMAAGLARGGMKPVVAIYSSFYQRAYDQIIHDACLQNLPITFCIDRAGIVGNDGETHQGVFDISFLRPVPNMVIMAPADENELQHMLYSAVEYPGPAAIRYPRGEGTGVIIEQELKKLPLGKGILLRQGEDILLLAVGSTVNPAVEAAARLHENGISAAVVNARFIKPLDEQLILSLLQEHSRVITVEEQVLAGGFGSSILELVNRNSMEGIEIKRLGLPDEFIPQGGQQEMRAYYQIDAEAIYQHTLEMVPNQLEVGLWPEKNA